MNGIKFLEKMENKFPDIPVLMITAYNDQSTALECRSKGAFDLLQKPFNRDQLLEAVHRALELRCPSML